MKCLLKNIIYKNENDSNNVALVRLGYQLLFV